MSGRQAKATTNEYEDEYQPNMGPLSSSHAYSAYNNPFNDPNLDEKFKWDKKKRAKLDARKDAHYLSFADAEEKDKVDAVRDKERHEELKKELAKLNKRRQEREAQRELFEKEKELQRKKADMLTTVEWQAKENEFHLNQYVSRAHVRMKEKRAISIDYLCISMNVENCPEPGPLVDSLRSPVDVIEKDGHGAISLLSDLNDDVDRILELIDVRNAELLDYWKSAKMIVLEAIKKQPPSTKDAIDADIVALLEDKSLPELIELKASIQSKLLNEPVDVEYWETLLHHCLVQEAKLKLAHFFETANKKRESLLRQRKSSNDAVAGTDKDGKQKAQEEDSSRTGRESAPVHVWDESKASLKMVADEANKHFSEDEEIFNTEVELNDQDYQWIDKYRPRKPRYFNRVQTGYEWNKYNQTHYDHENPPPKAVQGYKFNLFYPDLLNTKVPPTFAKLKDPANPDFEMLKFIAGPPYEDVAFRIVKRDWEYSHTHGYKCYFDRGILHLHFYFKRQRYKR